MARLIANMKRITRLPDCQREMVFRGDHIVDINANPRKRTNGRHRLITCRHFSSFRKQANSPHSIAPATKRNAILLIVIAAIESSAASDGSDIVDISSSHTHVRDRYNRPRDE